MHKSPFIFVIAVITAGNVFAAPAEQGNRPCRDDMLNHCGDRLGDREGMRSCVRENFSQFSTQCQTAIMERRQNRDQDQRQDPAGGNPKSSNG